jgi:YVTN family beta-propeller protein
MNMGWPLAIGCAGVLAVVGACGSSQDDGSAAGDFGPPAFGSGGAAAGNPQGPSAGGASSTGGAAGVPPEKETTTTFELPHAGERFVYVANPDSNTVAVIDAKSLSIQTVEAGAKPRFLQTLAAKDAAIVLNVDSHDATIVRTAESGASTTTKVDVERGSNAIAVSPDGKHAIVYYDATLSKPGEADGSLQDVTVITLGDTDTSIGMSVGFRPSLVTFSDDGKRAFVVTEDGVSILGFAEIEKSGAGIARTVPLGSTGIDKTLDVSITKDGKYALARRENASDLRLVDLESGDIQLLDLASVGGVDTPPANDGDAGSQKADSGAPAIDSGATPPSPPPSASSAVTDVDLSPTGTYALAVLRDVSTVVKIPIPGAFSDPTLVEKTKIDGELVGSVSLTPDGKRALLYTTAVATNERLTILDLEASEAKPLQLRKSVASVVVSPDSKTALIVHGKLPGSPDETGLDVETKLDRQDGYTLVALDTGYVKLQVTPAPLGPTTIVPDGSHLFVLFNAPGHFEVEGVDLKSFRIGSTTLGSPPVSLGSVPASERVFVGQDHPDGRISFIDWTTGAVQSVTGFELNSRIRE